MRLLFAVVSAALVTVRSSGRCVGSLWSRGADGIGPSIRWRRRAAPVEVGLRGRPGRCRPAPIRVRCSGWRTPRRRSRPPPRCPRRRTPSVADSGPGVVVGRGDVEAVRAAVASPRRGRPPSAVEFDTCTTSGVGGHGVDELAFGCRCRSGAASESRRSGVPGTGVLSAFSPRAADRR